MEKSIDKDDFAKQFNRVATGHGISRNHGKSWNFIWSGKSHGKQDFHEKSWKSHGTFFHDNLSFRLAKFITIEIQNLLHKF